GALVLRRGAAPGADRALRRARPCDEEPGAAGVPLPPPHPCRLEAVAAHRRSVGAPPGLRRRLAVHQRAPRRRRRPARRPPPARRSARRPWAPRRAALRDVAPAKPPLAPAPHAARREAHARLPRRDAFVAVRVLPAPPRRGSD